MKKYKKHKRQIRRYLSKFFDYLPPKTSYKNLLYYYSFTTYINEYLDEINNKDIDRQDVVKTVLTDIENEN